MNSINKNGCSICQPGSENYCIYVVRIKGKKTKMYQYDYRAENGELFTCFARTLEVPDLVPGRCTSENRIGCCRAHAVEVAEEAPRIGSYDKRRPDTLVSASAYDSLIVYVLAATSVWWYGFFAVAELPFWRSRAQK